MIMIIMMVIMITIMIVIMSAGSQDVHYQH